VAHRCHVQPIALEQPLVSETHQYGGTPDCVAIIDGKVALVELKTSVKPFADHLVAMAAHGALWNETSRISSRSRRSTGSACRRTAHTLAKSC
jgi:hypothetical protein